MRNWFGRIKLSRQLALVSCLFILIPMLLLWFAILRGQQDSAIQTRLREAQSRCAQVEAQVQRAAELCNMSTQVFLNTPALVDHLYLLKQDLGPGAAELLEFYRTNVSSLEKIILSNPDLYQIRVYAEADDIHEMMPILYSRRRMERMPWAGEDPASGSWHLDFDDQLFDNYPVTPHIMSLVTAITTSAQERVGVLEVAVRMDDILPDLFSGTEDGWAVLTDGSGKLLAGHVPADNISLEELAQAPDGEPYTLAGVRVLVTRTCLRDLDCAYVQVTSLTDIYQTILYQSLYLLAVVLAAFCLMLWAVSRLTRRLLRGFYGAFDGIRAFASGDVHAQVAVTGQGEAADFAREAGRLLDQIRWLMKNNLEREMDIRNAETRALQNQINAHFIYNVLEAIKMMAEIDEEYEIADAVTSLGKLLRYSMKLEGGGVRLDRELDYIRNYVALMNLRFDYVIRLEMDVPPQLMGQLVPKISLQPIVENAVVHGAAVMAADTVITLLGELDQDKGAFTISIADRGCGMDEAALARLRRQIAGEEPARSSSGNGIGLKNVQDRIRMAFGPGYGLTVASQPGRGTTVIAAFPYHAETEEDP
ncbi:MAG: sensor histidine kinase [Oscillospiraceae bacterium]|nr:sensor histidine kinase [Oscillospiraceae bacterium]